MIGQGEYSAEALLVRERTHAQGVIVIVLGGDRGSSYAAAINPQVVPQIPGILRELADKTAADAGLEPPAFAELAAKAIDHLLQRAQTDPDFGYLVGPGTESFELLCAAEAARKNLPVEQVKATRSLDLQAPHRWRPPGVVSARHLAETYAEQLYENPAHMPAAVEAIVRERHRDWLAETTRKGVRDQRHAIEAFQERVAKDGHP